MAARPREPPPKDEPQLIGSAVEVAIGGVFVAFGQRLSVIKRLRLVGLIGQAQRRRAHLKCDNSAKT